MTIHKPTTTILRDGDIVTPFGVLRGCSPLLTPKKPTKGQIRCREGMKVAVESLRRDRMRGERG